MAPKNRTTVKLAGAEFWPDDAEDDPPERDPERERLEAPPLEHGDGFRWVALGGPVRQVQGRKRWLPILTETRLRDRFPSI